MNYQESLKIHKALKKLKIKIPVLPHSIIWGSIDSEHSPCLFSAYFCEESKVVPYYGDIQNCFLALEELRKQAPGRRFEYAEGIWKFIFYNVCKSCGSGSIISEHEEIITELQSAPDALKNLLKAVLQFIES